MKKVEIHRDKKELSDEEILKHQNFSAVMTKASSGNSGLTPKSSAKWWWLGGGGGLAVVAGTVFLSTILTLNNATEQGNYTHSDQSFLVLSKVAPEVGDYELIYTASPVPMATEKSESPIHPTTPIKQPEQKIEFLKPTVVSTIPFKFEEAFGIAEQCKNIPELSIYENISFQPIGKYQKAWLDIQWDAVEVKKTEEGYQLKLTKKESNFICPVIPVFEDDAYLEALKTLQKQSD